MEQEELLINNVIKHNLDKMAYWAKLFGILGFIGSAIIVIVAIAMFIMGGDMGGMYGYGAGAAGFIYIILGVIYFIPSKYIYTFSTECRRALNQNSQNAIEEALSNLSSVFTFWGVFTVIILIIYALMFCALLLGVGSF